ncbi:MAG: threonine--tRNA ligase, partial [Candidatus Levybacteria bacterium]|nr:threonine--tRNA ligase [Candidatus Levybacteria bacterium]
LATIQLDFQIPERMRLEFVDKDGEKRRPVMIHRAVLGSLERFIWILTEHFQGSFPIWLSPVQVVVLPITDRHQEHARKIHNELQRASIRSEVDARAETLQAKIRDATLQKVPYMGIIGDKEVTSKNISVRTREGKDLGILSLSQFLQKVKDEIDKKV